MDQGASTDICTTPITAFHGTTEVFDTFDTLKQGGRGGVPGGFFFTQDFQVAAEVYGWKPGSRVLEAQLSIKRPLGFDVYFALSGKDKGVETGYGRDAPVNYFDNNASEIVAFALRHCFDGIVWPCDPDSEMQHDLVVVFNSEQIHIVRSSPVDQCV
jgi:hypothetical protein